MKEQLKSITRGNPRKWYLPIRLEHKRKLQTGNQIILNQSLHFWGKMSSEIQARSLFLYREVWLTLP